MKKRKKANYSLYAIVSFLAILVPLILTMLGGWSFKLFVPATTISLIFGFIALGDIKENHLKGTWMAIIGIALSLMYLVISMFT